MLSYDKWKLLNESLGRSVLGLSQKQSLGIVSNVNIPQIDEAGCGGKYEDGELDMDDSADDAEVDIEDYSDEDGDEMEVMTKKHKMSDDEDMDDMDDMDDEDNDEEDDEDDMDDEEGDDDDYDVSDEMDADMDDDGEEVDVDDTEMSDDDGDEEEEIDVTKKPTPKFAENKKLPKNMLDEESWWKSVMSMVGQAQPNGAIKNELYDASPNEPKLTGRIKILADKLKDIPVQEIENLTRAKDYTAVEQFVRPFIKELITKHNVSDSTIKRFFQQMIDEIKNEPEESTAEPADKDMSM